MLALDRLCTFGLSGTAFAMERDLEEVLRAEWHQGLSEQTTSAFVQVTKCRVKLFNCPLCAQRIGVEFIGEFEKSEIFVMPKLISDAGTHQRPWEFKATEFELEKLDSCSNGGRKRQRQSLFRQEEKSHLGQPEVCWMLVLGANAEFQAG